MKTRLNRLWVRIKFLFHPQGLVLVNKESLLSFIWTFSPTVSGFGGPTVSCVGCGASGDEKAFVHKEHCAMTRILRVTKELLEKYHA
jgi:hypothetical protein